jgi:hypothetical protein
VFLQWPISCRSPHSFTTLHDSIVFLQAHSFLQLVPLFASPAQHANPRSLYTQNVPPVQSPSKLFRMSGWAKDRKDQTHSLSPTPESSLDTAPFPLADFSKTQERLRALGVCTMSPHTRRARVYASLVSGTVSMIFSVRPSSWLGLTGFPMSNIRACSQGATVCGSSAGTVPFFKFKD